MEGRPLDPFSSSSEEEDGAEDSFGGIDDDPPSSTEESSSSSSSLSSSPFFTHSFLLSSPSSSENANRGSALRSPSPPPASPPPLSQRPQQQQQQGAGEGEQDEEEEPKGKERLAVLEVEEDLTSHGTTRRTGKDLSDSKRPSPTFTPISPTRIAHSFHNEEEEEEEVEEAEDDDKLDSQREEAERPPSRPRPHHPQQQQQHSPSQPQPQQQGDASSPDWLKQWPVVLLAGEQGDLRSLLMSFFYGVALVATATFAAVCFKKMTDAMPNYHYFLSLAVIAGSLPFYFCIAYASLLYLHVEQKNLRQAKLYHSMMSKRTKLRRRQRRQQRRQRLRSSSDYYEEEEAFEDEFDEEEDDEEEEEDEMDVEAGEEEIMAFNSLSMEEEMVDRTNNRTGELVEEEGRRRLVHNEEGPREGPSVSKGMAALSKKQRKALEAKLRAARRAFDCPKWKFFIMGSLDAMSGILLVYGGGGTDGSLQSLLFQGVIPITMLLSIFFLKIKYHVVEYCGAGVVLFGVFTSLYPTLRFPDWNALLYHGVFACATVPLSLSVVYKEFTLRQTGVNIVYLQAWSAFFQLLMSILLCPFDAVPKVGDSSIQGLPGAVSDGGRCFIGINTRPDDDCHLAWVPVVGYIIGNFLFNLCTLMVVKHGSAAIAYIANTVRLPLVAIAFHLRPVMGNRVLKWDSQGSLFNFAGLFFILTGLVLFLSRKLGLYVVVKKYLLEMAKKYYEEKQLQEQLMQHQAQQHRLFQQQQPQRTGRPSSSLSSSRNSAHRHHHSRHHHNPPRRHHRQHQNPYRYHRHDREEIEALLSSDDASSQPQRMTVN